MIVLLVALASIQLALTSGAGLSTVYSLKDLGNHWSVFKQTHSKKYTNSSHEMERKAKFQKNLIRINEHNARYSNGSETYFLGPTIFADWDAQEFASFVKSGGLNTNLISKNVTKVTLTKRVSAPASIDWRSNNGKNYVQAIKNQASCGSCWAFSSVSALESYAALSSNGNLPNLSEQNLVDCVYNYDTCNNGGQNTDAWSYVQRNGGIATGSNYPYKSGSTQTWGGGCRYSSSLNSGVKVTGWKQVGGGESGLANTIGMVGPVTAYIFAGNEKVITKFSLYKGGIYSDPACAGQQINHAVNLVGYTSSYYILRNSWGTGWGLSGYMYIQRGNNMCQVASYNLYPTVSYSGSSSQLNWQAGQPTGTVWALGCDFQRSDLTNRKVSGSNCASTCKSTFGCTHFTWTTYNGGTCWMKYGSVSRSDAFSTGDQTMVCGIIP